MKNNTNPFQQLTKSNRVGNRGAGGIGCRVSSLSVNQADPALCEASILQINKSDLKASVWFLVN